MTDLVEIKALPSFYRGVKFRSRLEARWAALFDHYEIVWGYEPEGFETPSGRYLPDFYLPELESYVEVKPEPFAFDYRAIKSVVDQTKRQFLILDYPAVTCRAYSFMFPDDLGRGEFVARWGDMAWCMSEKYLGHDPHDGKQRWFWDNLIFENRGASMPCPHCAGGHEPEHFNRIRSMRFENGHAV